MLVDLKYGIIIYTHTHTHLCTDLGAEEKGEREPSVELSSTAMSQLEQH